MTKPTAKNDAMDVETLEMLTLKKFEQVLREGIETQIQASGQLGFMIDVQNTPVELSESFAEGSDAVVVKVLKEYESLGWKTNWAHFLDDDDNETPFRITLA